MWIMTECTKVYGKTRTYYIHSPFCRAASRLARRMSRKPTRAEIQAEVRRTEGKKQETRCWAPHQSGRRASR